MRFVKEVKLLRRRNRKVSNDIGRAHIIAKSVGVPLLPNRPKSRAGDKQPSGVDAVPGPGKGQIREVSHRSRPSEVAPFVADDVPNLLSKATLEKGMINRLQLPRATGAMCGNSRPPAKETTDRKLPNASLPQKCLHSGRAT